MIFFVLRKFVHFNTFRGYGFFSRRTIEIGVSSVIADRMSKSFDILLELLNKISPSDSKKIFSGKATDMLREVSFMRQVFESTEENFERMEARKVHYTSYQQSFYREFKSIQLILKSLSVINKRTDSSMSLWNLIDNFEAIGKSNLDLTP